MVCFRRPFLEEEISDYIAHSPIIRVFTVVNLENRVVFKHDTFGANYLVSVIITRLQLHVVSAIKPIKVK